MSAHAKTSPRRVAQAMALIVAAGPAGIDGNQIAAALDVRRDMVIRFVSEARRTGYTVLAQQRGCVGVALYFGCKEWRDAAIAADRLAQGPARAAARRATAARHAAKRRAEGSFPPARRNRIQAEPRVQAEKPQPRQQPTGPVVPHRTAAAWDQVELPAGYVSALDPTDCRAWARAAAA